MNIEEVMQLVKTEHSKAISCYPKFASAHEGLAVLEEEFEELKAEVFKNNRNRNYDDMRKEAIQVAAMAIRFVIDVAPKENSVECDKVA